jgi:hypothetical protein
MKMKGVNFLRKLKEKRAVRFLCSINWKLKTLNKTLFLKKMRDVQNLKANFLASQNENPSSLLANNSDSSSFHPFANRTEFSIQKKLTKEEEQIGPDDESQLIQSDIRCLVLMHLMSEIIGSNHL